MNFRCPSAESFSGPLAGTFDLGSRQEDVRMQSDLIVGVGVAKSNGPVGTNQKHRRNRKQMVRLPRTLLEIDTVTFEGRQHFAADSVGQTKTEGRLHLMVGQELVAQLPFPDALAQLFRPVRAQGYDLETEILQLLLDGLQLNQLRVAVRSPSPPVEDQHGRFAGKDLGD